MGVPGTLLPIAERTICMRIGISGQLSLVDCVDINLSLGLPHQCHNSSQFEACANEMSKLPVAHGISVNDHTQQVHKCYDTSLLLGQEQCRTMSPARILFYSTVVLVMVVIYALSSRNKTHKNTDNHSRHFDVA